MYVQQNSHMQLYINHFLVTGVAWLSYAAFLLFA